jgi:hypothetical protein
MAQTKSPEGPGSISDWFCGGQRRRALLAALLESPEDGLTVVELQQASGCSQAIAYEVLRALRVVKLVRAAERPNSYALDRHHPLASPLEDWLQALGPFAGVAVERPRRGERSS